MIGNDIVDFKTAEEKYFDQRFVKRVFCPAEADFLAQAKHKNACLWSLWAAKESIYKALQRSHHQLIFSPKAIQLDDRCLGLLNQALVREHKQLSVLATNPMHSSGMNLEFTWPQNAVVHCTAAQTMVSSARNKSTVVSKLHNTNKNLCYQEQSFLVRQLAQDLLSEHHISADIVRPELKMNGYTKPGPPVLMDHDRQLLDHQISLSHDHSWLAVAVLIKSQS